jgi:hypothetical protein
MQKRYVLAEGDDIPQDVVERDAGTIKAGQPLIIELEEDGWHVYGDQDRIFMIAEGVRQFRGKPLVICYSTVVAAT